MAKILRFSSIDTETGEIVDVDRSRSAKWFKANMEGFGRLVKIKDIKIVEAMVIFKVFNELKYNNVVYINQTKWANDLGYSRESVNRAVKSLVKHGIIMKMSKSRMSIEYKLSHVFGWCGGKKDE